MMPTNSSHRRPSLPFALCAGLALAGLCGCEGRNRTQTQRVSAQGRVATGQEMLESGRLDEALAEFSRAIAENPTLTVAHVGLGDIHRQKGDYAAAQQAYRKAAELEPGNFKAQYSDGLMLQLLNRLAEAVRAYLRALSIQPSDFDANRNLATAYLQLSEPHQALAYARKAVQVRPKDGPARVNLGAVYAAMGRHNEAVLEYQAAAELMDLTPPLLLNLADSLGKAGRRQEMINTLEQLLKIEPSAPAHERMGFALFKLGRYDDALSSFRAALKLDADYYPALNGVGVCLMNQYLLAGRGDTSLRDEALRALRRSVQLNRDQPKIIELITRYG